jgi:hypothetical protein
MAQKHIVQLIDDLDGVEAQETVSFSLDGTRYEIDLSEDNANRLRDALAVYIANARRSTRYGSASGPATTVTASATRAASPPQSWTPTTRSINRRRPGSSRERSSRANHLYRARWRSKKASIRVQASAAAAGSGPTFSTRSIGRSTLGPVSASFRNECPAPS